MMWGDVGEVGRVGAGESDGEVGRCWRGGESGCVWGGGLGGGERGLAGRRGGSLYCYRRAASRALLCDLRFRSQTLDCCVPIIWAGVIDGEQVFFFRHTKIRKRHTLAGVASIAHLFFF